jgi:hypothetical protein
MGVKSHRTTSADIAEHGSGAHALLLLRGPCGSLWASGMSGSMSGAPSCSITGPAAPQPDHHHQ